MIKDRDPCFVGKRACQYPKHLFKGYRSNVRQLLAHTYLDIIIPIASGWVALPRPGRQYASGKTGHPWSLEVFPEVLQAFGCVFGRPFVVSSV